MFISPTEEIAGTQNDPCTPKASNFYHDGPSVTDWTKKRYRVPKTTRYFDRSAIYQIHTINDDGQTYSHVLLAQLLTSTHVHDVSQLVPSNNKQRLIANPYCHSSCLLLIPSHRSELSSTNSPDDSIEYSTSRTYQVPNRKVRRMHCRGCQSYLRIGKCYHFQGGAEGNPYSRSSTELQEANQRPESPSSSPPSHN